MPAAAVIPAPIAYIKVVAVKKLVVGTRAGGLCPAMLRVQGPGLPSGFARWSFIGLLRGGQDIYCEKIRVFKAGVCCEYISME